VQATTEAKAYDDKGFAGHPRGLGVLFFTELWERFSYYGMRALLILFLTKPALEGGLGMTAEKGASIYGWYTSLVYAMAIPGGWIADQYIGLRHAVLVGGILIALGHFSMAFGSVTAIYVGLGLIICGTGLLKPNISSMVGALYGPEDRRRDAGFSLFYMGINIGAWVAPFICSTLGEKFNWHWGFAAAGIGMTFGLIQYVWGWNQLGSAGLKVSKKEGQGRFLDSFSTLSAVEWKRILAVFLLFLFASLFWGAFDQAGSSLNLFADRLTERKIFGWEFPAGWFQSVNAFFIVTLAPVFAWLWIRLGKYEPSSPAKFAFGLLFVGLGFLLMAWAAVLSGSDKSLVSPWWLVVCYLLHTIGELALSPVGLSTVTKLAPASLVGSMMGLWFLSIALGNKIGGWVAGYFETFPLPQLFGAVFLTTASAALILLFLINPIRRLMSGVH
jgi:POT family proton-dependent oligopeptide transporter